MYKDNNIQLFDSSGLSGMQERRQLAWRRNGRAELCVTHTGEKIYEREWLHKLILYTMELSSIATPLYSKLVNWH